MVKIMACSVLAVCGILLNSGRTDAAETQMAHIVFFTVDNATAEAKEKLAAGCQKYLSGHDGTVYFSVGLRSLDMDRDVNDREFDVALHLVFKDKASYDKYSEHPRHMKFIEEFKSLWSEVRVMDSYVVAKKS